MNTDLVRAAGMQRGFRETGMFEHFHASIAGVGGFAIVVVQGRHAFSMRWMTGDRDADFA